MCHQEDPHEVEVDSMEFGKVVFDIQRGIESLYLFQQAVVHSFHAIKHFEGGAGLLILDN